MKNDKNETDNMDYIDNFIKKRLSCGKSILELTTVNRNITMWWCVDTLFYNFVESTKTIKSNKLAFQRYLLLIYSHFGIYLELLFDLSIMVLLKFIRLIYRKEFFNSSQKIIFTSQDIEWKMTRNQETKKIIKTDAFFDSIFMHLAEWSLVGVSAINIYPVRGLRIYLDKLKNWNIRHFALNEFWSFDAYKKQRLALKHYKKQLSYIKDDEELKRICVYNGQDMYQKIFGEINLYFIILFPYQIKLMQMTHNMIKHQKPDIIVFQNEYGWTERPMLIAAQKDKIPTIAIQHGMITLSHRGYIYRNRFQPWSPQIPDKTAVYGKYYYDMLINDSIYTKRNVVITGQPRYDILNQISTMYSKERYFKNLSIPLQNKVVLWTTQCHGLSDEENNININCILETVQQLEGLTLIIKPHPAEPERYRKQILSSLKDFKADVRLVAKNSDTYEHIFSCDLLLTKTSTTAMEAAALNKPIILLNLIEGKDFTGYVNENIAIGVYNCHDLKINIQNLLNDDSVLAKNRQEFVANLLCKIDGRSSERVADLIKDVISRTS